MHKLRFVTPALVAASLLLTSLGVSAAGPNNFNEDHGQSRPISRSQSPAVGNGQYDWVVDSTPSPFAWARFDGEYWGDNTTNAYSSKVYFLGGRNTDLSTDGTIWRYNPATHTEDFFTYKPSFQAGVAAGRISVQLFEGRAVVVGPRMYVRKLLRRLASGSLG